MQENGKLSAAVVNRMLNGEVLMIGEWRQCKIDAIKMRDAKTGSVRNSVVVRHGLETATEQFSVSEWLPDGTDPASVKVVYTRGQRVLVKVSTCGREKGLLMIGGTIESIPA